MNVEDKKEYHETTLQYLEYTYSGAKMLDDLEEMTKIARAIEAYNLDVNKDCVIKCI